MRTAVIIGERTLLLSTMQHNIALLTLNHSVELHLLHLFHFICSLVFSRLHCFVFETQATRGN